MINVVQDGEIYTITFPYDFQVKELVKQVPGRRWVPEKKCWTIPKDSLGSLINVFLGTEYQDAVKILSDEHININAEIAKTDKIPDYDISNVKTYVNSQSKLYEHQIDFLKYGLYREKLGNMSGFLVCDDQGLGKSLEAINLALINRDLYGFKHCLIICCVNTSKYNWMNEISFHTNGSEEGYILGSRVKRNGTINYNGSFKDKLYDLENNCCYGSMSQALPYFIITNIETLRTREGRKHPFTKALIQMIDDNQLNMIVVDEVHKNTSPQSQQGSQLLATRKDARGQCLWLPMTGTPIVNKPTDLFLPLRLVNAHQVNSYWDWDHHYCIYGGFGNHDIVGNKNMKQLQKLLSFNMIRRLKEDVLDLPDKVELVQFVENTPYQNKLIKELTGQVQDHKEEILESLNPLAALMRLRQVNGSPEIVDENCTVDDKYLSKNAKLQRLIELVYDIVERGEKVVVFSNWVQPLRTIYRYLCNDYQVCVFTGTMKDSDRQAQKQAFIHDENKKIMLGTIGSLGTTHTLTAANNIIFYDEPWTAADRNQAIDRIHRIGTTKTCNIYTLISRNTVDERVHTILYGKATISKLIVDNQINLRHNPELFDYLVSN